MISEELRWPRSGRILIRRRRRHLNYSLFTIHSSLSWLPCVRGAVTRSVTEGLPPQSRFTPLFNRKAEKTPHQRLPLHKGAYFFASPSPVCFGFRLRPTRAVGDAGPYDCSPEHARNFGRRMAPLSGELSSEARLKGCRRTLGLRLCPTYGGPKQCRSAGKIPGFQHFSCCDSP